MPLAIGTQRVSTPVAKAASQEVAAPTGPRVSVVMPTYREQQDVLERAIDSILSQTLTDLELIVVLDDPDNTSNWALLERRAADDSRLRLHVNDKNVGVWASYNVGLRLARGRFIAIQDSDDASDVTRLEILCAYLEAHPDVDVVGASLEYVDASTGRRLLTRHYPADVERSIRRFCPMAHGTTVRRSGLHSRYGYYDESTEVRHAADYELWCRWHARGAKLRNTSDVVYRYYQYDTNFKNTHVRPILRDTVTIKRRYARALRFGLGDRVYLEAQALLTCFPSSVITAAFYFYNRLAFGRVPDRG